MLSGAVFLLFGLGGIAAVVYMLFFDRSHALERLDRRMAVQDGPAPVPVVARRPRRQLTMPAFVAPLLARAEIEPTPQLFAIIGGVLALGTSLAFALLGVLVALIALTAGIVALIVYVRIRAERRTDALIEALPFYVDGVRQLMNIGTSLPQALTRSLPAAAVPIQRTFSPAARRIELGAPVGDSIQQLADRIAVPEVAMLAAAIRTNLRFGGSMTSVLNNLSQVVRERTRVKRELASATAEAKISTQLLVAIPLLLIVGLFLTSPTHRAFFLHDPRGHHQAIFAAVMQAIGTVLMVRMKRLPL